jgi:hypothetical protein
MPIGLEFTKATAERLIADLASGRPIGVIEGSPHETEYKAR